MRKLIWLVLFLVLGICAILAAEHYSFFIAHSAGAFALATLLGPGLLVVVFHLVPDNSYPDIVGALVNAAYYVLLIWCGRRLKNLIVQPRNKN